MKEPKLKFDQKTVSFFEALCLSKPFNYRWITWLIWIALFLVPLSSFSQGRDGGDRADGGRDKDTTPTSVTISSSVDFESQHQALTGFGDTFQKSIEYDPVLETNPNRGEFLTEIKIETPPNLLKFNLKLEYTHTNPVNMGMGYGWKWNLPSIVAMSNSHPKAQYQSQGSIGSYELVQVNEDLNSYKSAIDQTLSRSKITTAFGMIAFRPAVDREGTLFIELKENKAKRGWLVLKLDGTRWLFDDMGRPKTLSDIHGNLIRFEWQTGLLVAIHNADWSTFFQYQTDQQTYPQKVSGVWFQPPYGLESITHSGGNLSRKIRFNYQEKGYLSRAMWDGAWLPEFQAVYDFPKTSWTAVSSNNVGENTNAWMSNANRYSPPTWGVDVDPHKRSDVFVDLNGDGRTDIVTYNWRAKSKVIERITVSEKDPEKYFQRAMNKAKVPITVQIAVGNSNSSDVRHVPSQTLEITNILEPAHYNAEWEGARTNKKMNVKMTSHAIRFVDINSDGLKDIVWCAGNRSAQRRAHLAAKRGNRKWFVPHTLVEIGKLFSPADFKKRETVFDPKNWNGGPAQVFIQKFRSDLKLPKLQQIDDSVIANATQWVPANAPFRCHEESVFFDANLDGKIDVLTANTIFLNGTEGDRVDFNPLSTQFLQHFERGNLPLSASSSNVSYLDLDSDGLLEVYSAPFINYDFSSQSLLIFTPGQTYSTNSLPLRKPLVKMDSPFGGQVDLDYQHKDQRWVISKITKDPKTATQSTRQPTVSRNFEYKQPIFDEFFGLFVGFSKVNETKTTQHPSVTPQVTTRFYHKEVDPNVVLFRSRGWINGFLTYEAKGKSEDLPRSVKWTKNFEFVPLDKDRVWLTHQSVQEGTYNEDGVIFHNLVETLTRHTGWEQDSSGNKLFPHTTIKEEIGGGQFATLFAEINNAHRTTANIRQFDPNNYRQVLSRQDETSGIKNTKSKILVHQRNDKGELIKTCLENRCGTYAYDSLGRVITTTDERGLRQELAYWSHSPLVTKVNSQKGFEEYHYDWLTGLKTEIKNSDGGSWYKKYSADGHLTKVDYQENSGGQKSLYEVRLPEKKCDIAKCTTSREIQIRNYDQWQTWLLDGFGRTFQKLTHFKTGVLSSGESIFGDKGVVVAQTDPASPQAFLFQNEIDELEKVRFQTKLSGETQQNFRSDSCDSTRINTDFLYQTCKDDFDNTSFYRQGALKQTWQTNGEGEVVFEKSNQLTWDYNNFGELTKSRGPWGTTTIEHKDSGLISERSDGLVITRNPWGAVTALEDKNSSHALKSNFEYKNGKLIGVDLRTSNGTPFLKTNFEHNGMGQVKLRVDNLTKESYTFDYFNRVESVTHENGTSLRYVYDGERLVSILPLIKKISYSVYNNVSQIQYTSGATVRFDYVPGTSRRTLTQLTSSSGDLIWSEQLTYDSGLRISGRETKSLLAEQQQKVISTENFPYNEKYQLDFTKTNVKLIRDKMERVISIGSTSLNWDDDRLYEVDNKKILHQADGKFAAVCGPDSVNAINCFVRHSDDVVSVNGKVLKLIRLANLPVGLIANDKLYPLIADHLTSVRLVLDPEDNQPLFDRKYGPWGEKTVLINNKDHEIEKQAHDLEPLVAFSFAGLLEAPIGFLSPGQNNIGSANVNANAESTLSANNQPFYFSQTRQYHPTQQEWLSPDHLVKFRPAAIANHPNNWSPYQYAAGQPLMLLDVTGELAPLAAGALLGGVLGGTAGALGAMATNSNIAQSFAIGAISGAAIATVGGIPGLTGVAKGFLAAIAGFTANLTAQVAITGQVQIEQALLAGAFGSLTSASASQLTGNTFDLGVDLAVGMTYLPKEILASFATKEPGSIDLQNASTSGGDVETFEKSFEKSWWR